MPKKTNNQPKISNFTKTSSNISQLNDSDEELEGVNKQSLAYIITKKYSALKNRNSILDDSSENSYLNKSVFKGFYNLVIVLGIVLLVIYPIKKYRKEGIYFNTNLSESMNRDLWIALSTWPLLYIWSYNAYFLQKFIKMGMNKYLASIYQHTSQSLMFIYCMYMIINNAWCTSHSGFASMVACSLFMKMHSYTLVNNDYRQDYLDCKKSTNKTKNVPISIYPNNITFWNFTVYMWMPILVYQDVYPRSGKFRLSYFLKKAFLTFQGVVISYVILSEFVLPNIELGDKISFFELFTRIVIPMWIFVKIIFFTVWEGMCNAFAELTQFGDRQFYLDWWNSTTYEEFNRKWNRCVYNFLFRHTYLECHYRLKWSKGICQLVTFVFSALLHEWILLLTFKIIRPIMTLCMIQQLPLFYITKWLHKKRAGNFLVWFGLLGGVPFIGICYLRSHPEITHHYSYLGDFSNFDLIR